MRNALIALLVTVAVPLFAADREITLARQMLEDAIIRDDVRGIELARERLLRLTDSEDRMVMRDAHYLIGLSGLFEASTGLIDVATGARAIEIGMQHADRAIELDPQFADAWMIAALLRRSAPRWGVAVPNDPPDAPNRMKRAVEIDPKSPPVAFFNAMFAAFNPAGAAPASAVKMIDDLAQRLDAERTSSGRPFGLWDAEAHVWQLFVRRAQDDPPVTQMRQMAAQLLAQRPDFSLGQQVARTAREHRFVAAPAVTWEPWLTDPSGDGKNPSLPDVIAVDRADDGDRAWYRITVREPLPKSFGTNLVINRSGDLTTGVPWWGTGSNFKFDRLLTAYITRDGDRYFGNVGLTDAEGVKGMRMDKLPADIQLAISDDNRSVMIGVPRSALGLTDASKMIAAVGTHLVWNDDATNVVNSR